MSKDHTAGISGINMILRRNLPAIVKLERAGLPQGQILRDVLNQYMI